MKTSTRVNLHCHSVFSDGELSPEDLAERLAEAGVVYAALTDHDTIEGLARFHSALQRHNVAFLPGVEISTHFHGREIHLLAYGFDGQHQELRATLQVLRHDRLSRIQGPLRRMPSQLDTPKLEVEPAPGVAATGKIAIAEAIALVHRAGGLVFLAHPLKYESEPGVLSAFVVDLQDMGLDGLEVTGDRVSAPEREALEGLAHDRGLLICAGTDLHGMGAAGKATLGVDMPVENWKRLVHSMGPAAGSIAPTREVCKASETDFEQEEARRCWSSFRPRIVLPSLLTIVLFVVAIWGMILPAIEKMLVDRKREMIRELTHTAVSLLSAAEREARAGRLSRGEAQQKAKAYIGALRYGKEGKDYFWIQDMHPHMLMHPYRSDLNGQDVSGFTDLRGVRIFVQFTRIVRRQEKGFVEYVWQWKDDPGRLAAKESYICGFRPWNWVIGTGMYIDDVKQEVVRIEQNIAYTLTAIVVLVFIVLFSNVRQSLNVEKKRTEMRASLQQAEERYRSLIEATTEGTLLILDGRCRYGNPTMLHMTGYGAERLELLELSDLLPRDPVNEAVWTHIEGLPQGSEGSKSFEALLERADGEKRECIVTLIPMAFTEHPGIICVIKEITDTAQRENRREALIEKQRLSLLFLQEPVGPLGRPVVTCNPETTIHEAASLMVQHDTTFIVVESDAGEIVGFLTDRDFSTQLAANRGEDLPMPVKTLMRYPLITISGRAMIYEALMLMEEKKAQHLALEDGRGHIGSVVQSNDLLQFHRYGPEVLPREIDRAATIEQVVRCCQRLPVLVKALMEAGARPRTVAYMNSAVCDAATRRFIELAVEELGPPPAAFTFIAMGSQGRQEQTLLTDQDNAIIYQEHHGAAGVEASDYFLSLGRRVCRWLNRAGYALCDGNVMAENPDWCRSLPEWKENFSDWILKAEPKELLDFSICLDFRPVYGEAELAHTLRTFIYKVLKDRPSFLPHLAQNALLFKPPFRLLGRIIKTSGPGQQAGRLNMKETLMPVIGFGRLYALRHKLPLTHSMERIEALVWKRVLQHSACDAVSASYDLLMRLRFQAQLAGLQSGGPPDNCIVLNKIGTMDEAMLKQAFLQIESLQKKIGYDFLGGAEWPGH
jgi:PAS domain S-box-containing protein